MQTRSLCKEHKNPLNLINFIVEPMNPIVYQSHYDPALFERVNGLVSQINVQKTRIEEFIENGVSKETIDATVIECFALLEEFSRSVKKLENQNPLMRAKIHKFSVQLGLFLLPRSDSEKPIRAKLLAFTEGALREAYPEMSYDRLSNDNLMFHWLRREGLGYKEPFNSGRFGPYTPHFPVSDSELDRFFQEKRKKIFAIMIDELGPHNFFTEPFPNNGEAIEYFGRYKEFLQYSTTKLVPQELDDPKLLGQ